MGHRKIGTVTEKGDISLCKNWRGMCLLDIASKILSSLLVRRMQILMEEEGMEEVCRQDYTSDKIPIWVIHMSTRFRPFR